MNVEAVHRIVSNLRTVHDVIDKTFCIASFNVLCCTDDGKCIPNEIGIVKYSIGRGIEDHYHCFIHPGSIPLGYMRVSKEHSADTHMIPISGFERADKNYYRIFEQILDFVNPMQSDYAPVFCAEEIVKQNALCFEWLSSEAGHSEDHHIRFYDVTCLLMELRAKINRGFSSRTAAVDLLSNHIFDYTPYTRCDYHEDLDNAYCALGCAKRICFIFSDALCTLYGVSCTPSHLPPLDAAVPAVFPSSRPCMFPGHADHRNTPKLYNNLAARDYEKTVKNSDTELCQSWMKKFCQPQPDVSFSKDDYPPLNRKNSSTKLGEIRQPFTNPLILSQGGFLPKLQFELHKREN